MNYKYMGKTPIQEPTKKQKKLLDEIVKVYQNENRWMMVSEYANKINSHYNSSASLFSKLQEKGWLTQKEKSAPYELTTSAKFNLKIK